MIVEVGPRALEPAQQRKLLEQCFAVLDLTNDSTVHQIHDCGGDQSYGWVKTPGEIYALATFLQSQDFVTPQDRVFKISGRYQLTAGFDLQQHQCPGKLVMAQRTAAVQYIDPQGAKHPMISQYQYPTRLYSFCGSMIPVMSEIYVRMFNRVIQHYGIMEFVDVEHMMFAECQNLGPVELSCMGVAGHQAPDGEWIWE